MKQRVLCLVSLLILLFVGGCSVKGVGNSVVYSIKGSHYLHAEDPEKGVEQFRREVQADPESPLSNYYYGRMLLRQEKVKEALPYLKKARDIDPRKADYHFWVGIAYGRLHDTGRERDSYKKALVVDPDHPESLTYLGHYYLKEKNYQKALDLYVHALEIHPHSPSVLYNRAFVLSKLRRTPEELIAWKMYLEDNRSGALARKAVEHLNKLDDYSYRNYQLGARTITVAKIDFEPFGSRLTRTAKSSLKIIGETAVNLQSGVLQVVVYQKNNSSLARDRAKSIRAFLYNTYPELENGNLGISWFEEPQKIRKTKKRIEESVDFFISSK